MNSQRLAITLTVVNLVLLGLVLSQVRSTEAQGVAPVLRGRALEIVDNQGRVRASIIVQPADPTMRMTDGKAYPETVIFRLIDPKGRPVVKLGGSEQGGGLGLVGVSDTPSIVLKTEGDHSSLKLTDKDGREQLVKP